MNNLTLGYSPCPNDTFIFYALTHGKVDAGGLAFDVSHQDVETLNRRALAGELDVTKISCHALAYLREEYCLLRSGGALGRGCGPLVVSKEFSDMDSLIGKTVAVPGMYTTALLLLKLCDVNIGKIVPMPFEKIMPAVADGDADAGLIIHEGRFTYPVYGLKKLMDLGEWWEAETGLSIPLGCIVAKRSLGPEVIEKVQAGIRKSFEYAFSRRAETRPYIKAHAQEMDDAVIDSHINLYVNDFSLDLGFEGEKAVSELLARAEARGIAPHSAKPLFI